MSGLFDVSTPQKRERFLLIVGAVMFLVFVIVVFNFLFGGDVTKQRRLRNQLRADIEKLETDIQQKDMIKRRLTELTNQSLPPDAQSVYQNWLLDTAYEAGLQERRVDTGSVSSMKDHYKKYTFTLHGRGTLEQISEFLRVFNKTEYLHLVRRVAPRSIKNSNEMDVSITVEALTLPKSRPSRSLRSMPNEKLSITDTEKEMLKEITSRNLFAPYSPPRPDGPKPETSSKQDDFDHSPYCFVIASIVDKEGKPQVWVNLRTEGKLYKLHEGDMFRLGGVRCFVRKIGEKQVTFEAAGGFYTIKVGKSFAEYE